MKDNSIALFPRLGGLYRSIRSAIRVRRACKAALGKLKSMPVTRNVKFEQAYPYGPMAINLSYKQVEDGNAIRDGRVSIVPTDAGDGYLDLKGVQFAQVADEVCESPVAFWKDPKGNPVSGIHVRPRNLHQALLMACAYTMKTYEAPEVLKLAGNLSD